MLPYELSPADALSYRNVTKVVPAVLAGAAFAEAGASKASRDQAQHDSKRAFINELSSVTRYRRHAASGGTSSSGMAANSSKASSSNMSRIDASSAALFEPLIKLREVLTRYEHLRRLPNPSMALAELLKPFLAEQPSLEACSLALSIVKRVFTVYEDRSPAEELQRWIWCCEAMCNVDIQPVRHQASQLLIACTSSPEPAYTPRGAIALQALTHALVRLHFALHNRAANSSESETAAPRNIVFSLLNTLASGALVSYEEDPTVRRFPVPPVIAQMYDQWGIRDEVLCCHAAI